MTAIDQSFNLEADHGNSSVRADHIHRRTFILHISCKRCHHLHADKQIQIPGDGDHLRIDCDKCNGALCGIGGTSRRSSLASCLTSSSWEEGPTPSTTLCTNVIGADSSPGGRSRSTTGPPTVVLGGGSAGITTAAPSQQPSENLLSLPNENSAEEGSSTSGSALRDVHNEVAGAREPPQGSLQDLPAHAGQHEVVLPRKAKSSHKIKIAKMLNFLSRRILRRPVKTPENIANTSTMVENSVPQRSRIRRTRPDMQSKAIQEQTDPDQTALGTVSPSSNTNGDTTQLSMPNDQVLPVRSEVGDNGDNHSATPSNHTAQPDEMPEDVWNPTAEKAERLEVKRRELTKRKHALRSGTCRCSNGCHCYTARGGAHTPRSLDSHVESHIPDHSLGRLIVPSSSSTNPHSSTSRDSLIPHPEAPRVTFADNPSFEIPQLEPPNPANHRASRISDISGTTLTGSSSSGARSARQLAQRAQSLPALRIGDFFRTLHEEGLHDFVAQNRPNAMQAVREYDTVDHPQHASSDPDREADHENERTDSTDFAVDDHAGGQPDVDLARLSHVNTEELTHGRVTSLSHMPEPSDEQPTAESTSDHSEEAASSEAVSLTEGPDEGSNTTTRLHSPGDGPPPPPESRNQHDEVADELEEMTTQTTTGTTPPRSLQHD